MHFGESSETDGKNKTAVEKCMAGAGKDTVNSKH